MFALLSSRQIVRSSYRFKHTLAFLETNGTNLTPASLSTLNAANLIKKPIIALLVGPNATEAASNVSKIEGISKTLVQNDERYEHYLPEQVTPLITNILKDSKFEISSFILPASAVGKNILPRVAAIMDIQPLSEITKVIDSNTFVRSTYAGNAILTVKSNEPIVMTSVRSSSFPSNVNLNESSNNGEIINLEYIENDCKTKWISENLTKSDKPDLSTSKIVISGGRALKDKETFEKLLNPLADKLHAAIGASRVAVDEGFCDNSLQVGQTGKIIEPEIYFAIGISGAIQHLAGMKDSKIIVAINKDEEAPIFKNADIGLVGDIFEIVPELTEKI